ncbi:modular serine protease-like [Condylostylus longicornis]|uniref:modular serine protease-like n=1 Tax=Condylostylus longicornis TaxID=2530218 RepID=UPI00244E21E4|nr:modular serine protease-like [Condylostylus longicornis]
MRDYLKFDKTIKPSCLGRKINFSCFVSEGVQPQYENKCFTPKLEHPERIEVLCYNYEIETFYEVASTGGGVLGGSRTVEEPYDTEDSNDCESVCGEIDRIYEPDSIPLLYKGSPVDILSAPWHVGIYTNNTNPEFDQVCGGTLIHSNIIITAGHCFDNHATGRKFPASNYLVGAGKRYRKFDLDERFQHFAGVKEIHTPQNYQSDPVRNDIAVLILDHHIEYTSHIKPVCVEWKPYNDYHVKDNVIGRLFGWGSTTLDDRSSGELLTIQVLTITNALCKKMVHPNYKAEITGDRFCSTNNANATACRGDSGGGFVIKKGFGNYGNYYLLGVVSAGIDYSKYCSDGFITTFTNIQFFQDFLKFIIMSSRKND